MARRGPPSSRATHQVFLADRYLPGATLEDVRGSVRLLADAIRSTRAVRHVSSTLLPDEGAVFALFLAESAEAVVAVNALADQRVDRLVEGLHVRLVGAGASPNRGTSPIPGERTRP